MGPGLGEGGRGGGVLRAGDEERRRIGAISESKC